MSVLRRRVNTAGRIRDGGEGRGVVSHDLKLVSGHLQTGRHRCALPLSGKDRKPYKRPVLETMHILSPGNCMSGPSLMFDEMMKRSSFL